MDITLWILMILLTINMTLHQLIIVAICSLLCWITYYELSSIRYNIERKINGIWHRITNRELFYHGRKVVELDITLWTLIIQLTIYMTLNHLITVAICSLLCWISCYDLSSIRYNIERIIFGITNQELISQAIRARKINGIWQEPIPQGIRARKINGIWQEPIPQGIRVQVTHVPDGDGVHAYDPKTGDAFDVRLIGIDAPEMKGQAFSKEAKNYLSKLVLGNLVTLVTYNEDQYGRTLGSIYIGGGKDCVSIMMLKKGLAHIYTGRNAEYGGEKKAFIAAEHNARNLRLGVWSSRSTQHPADFKRALRNGF